jgi:hypothetical protein
MKHIVAVLLIISSSMVFGQKEHILRLFPLSFFDPLNPAFNIGYEVILNEHYSFLFCPSLLFPSVVEKLYGPGYRVRFEGRKYLSDINLTRHNTFLGIEGLYLSKTFKDVYSYISSDSISIGGSYYLDSITISKEIYAINFKLGYQYSMHRWLFNVYAGLGVKLKDITHLGRLAINDNLTNIHFEQIFIPDNPGRYWILNIPINLSIGYRF